MLRWQNLSLLLHYTIVVRGLAIEAPILCMMYEKSSTYSTIKFIHQYILISGVAGEEKGATNLTILTIK
jgi:hypothetical protein